MGVCEHPQRDVQVSRARRRVLHLISPQNCCSVPTCYTKGVTDCYPAPQDYTWEYQPVFSHSLQFSSLGACHTPPGHIVTNTTTGAQAPATYIKQFMNSVLRGNKQNSAPRCFTSLPPAVSAIHSSSFPDSYLLSYF